MKDISEILEYPIHDKGIGDIEIGMSADVFINKYVNTKLYYTNKILKVSTFFPRNFIFTFYDSISIYIDIGKAIITRINLYNQYQGKYLDKINIGSQIMTLREIEQNIYLDEDEYLLLSSTISIQANEDIQRAIYENFLFDLFIERFVIEQMDLNNDGRQTIWELYDDPPSRWLKHD